jgi:FtsP/CotA-like multicopper oxidase with cupredoxin domain
MLTSSLRARRRSIVMFCLCATVLVAIGPAAAAAEHVAVNDNRIAAGTLTNGALTVRLEARSGEWHPDGEREPGIVVRALAVEGGPLQIPAPLVRVPEGTTVHLFFRNRLDGPLEIHGLYSRPSAATGDATTVQVAAGDTGEVTFPAGRAGTYYYWAASVAGTRLSERTGLDSQMSGAFVIDPRGSAPSPDRILVIGWWKNATATAASVLTAGRFVINGLSWPHTERLAYRVGDTVHIRVINAGFAVHPMHLHGFYFNVDSRGVEQRDVLFPSASSPHMVVTERLPSGATFSLTWKPTRPGNWLFHCHDNVHLVYGGTLDGSPSTRSDPHHHVENHALEMMSGPILGITVTGKSTEAAAPSGPRRQLRLIVRADAGGTDAEPAFAYAVEEAGKTGPATLQLPGPTIVLKRGEPVAITVVNELQEPTAVHWHGIELESYYDGVAGFAGTGTHIAPAIPPGGSFEARFTPPRSGTFIYHTHIDEVRQQQAGLSGPLLVVDAPSLYDPTHDRVLMVTVPRKSADGDVVLINGTATPPAAEMRIGEHYRLRFISLHVSRASMRMRLLSDSALLSWRALAKDGRDLPADQAVSGPSEIQTGNGETYDFEFVPVAAGELRLDVTTGAGVLLTSLPIHVR